LCNFPKNKVKRFLKNEKKTGNLGGYPPIFSVHRGWGRVRKKRRAWTKPSLRALSPGQACVSQAWSRAWKKQEEHFVYLSVCLRNRATRQNKTQRTCSGSSVVIATSAREMLHNASPYNASLYRSRKTVLIDGRGAGKIDCTKVLKSDGMPALKRGSCSFNLSSPHAW